MLDECGHGGESLVAELSQGFRLSGRIPDSHVFRQRRTTAVMTVSQLETTAPVIREHVIASTVFSGDADLDDATCEATADELERGWLWGPISPSDLPDHAVVTRRFGIWQSSGENVKCRPIDNYKESLVNLTTSANETITLHSRETIAAGISLAMQRAKESSRRVPLLMQSYDLIKAAPSPPQHCEKGRGCFG